MLKVRYLVNIFYLFLLPINLSICDAFVIKIFKILRDIIASKGNLLNNAFFFSFQ